MPFVIINGNTKIKGCQLDERSDQKLALASKYGDKGAYAELVKKYYRLVFAVCLGILGNIDDAEDIAQDTMLTGYLKITKLHKNEKFCQWILKIAKNLCIDLLRRKKHVKSILAEHQIKPEQKGDDSHLISAITKLPMELRLPLVMYYFDNKNAENIAETLKISHSTVCSRIREARKHLHKLLTERK